MENPTAEFTEVETFISESVEWGLWNMDSDKGSKAGNVCLCVKGSDTVIFLPGNFGGKDDGDTQKI